MDWWKEHVCGRKLDEEFCGGQKGRAGRQTETGPGKLGNGMVRAANSEQSDLPVGRAAIAGVGHG